MNKFEKWICGVLIEVFVFLSASAVYQVWTYEPAPATHEVAAVVDEANEETGLTTLVDAHGEAWVWDGLLEEGQLVIIKFDDMGTADIYDDEIIQIIF